MDADDNVPSLRTLRAATERLTLSTSEQPKTGPAVKGQGFSDACSKVHSNCCLQQHFAPKLVHESSAALLSPLLCIGKAVLERMHTAQ